MGRQVDLGVDDGHEEDGEDEGDGEDGEDSPSLVCGVGVRTPGPEVRVSRVEGGGEGGDPQPRHPHRHQQHLGPEHAQSGASHLHNSNGVNHFSTRKVRKPLVVNRCVF